MTRRRRKGRVGTFPRRGEEVAGTVVAALGLVPGVGTAAGVFDTSRRAVKTARATARVWRVLKGNVKPRRRKSMR